MNKTQKNRELKRKQHNLDDFREQFNILYLLILKSKNSIREIERFFRENRGNLNRLILVDTSHRPISKSQSTGSNVSFFPILSVLFPILPVNQRKEVVDLFVKYGGDLNQTNYKGDHSALYAAILLGDKGLIKKLIDSHADLDVLKGYQKNVYNTVTGSVKPKAKTRKNAPLPKLKNKNVTRKKASPKPSPKRESPKPSPKQDSPKRESPKPSPKPSPKQDSPKRESPKPSPKRESPKPSPKKVEILPYGIPVTHYEPSEEPAFWKPIFQEGEMLNLREKIHEMMREDCDLGARGFRNDWGLCNKIKNILPTYFVPTQSKPYIHRSGMAYGVSPIDFSNFNVILCASFLVFGMVNDRMKDQDYQFLLKGGKAIQLALAETEDRPYESEDIDILILPKKAYDREEIKQVAGHLASLLKWFVELPTTYCNISIQSPDGLGANPGANPDLFKLSYILTAIKGPRQVFKAFSDIDFKEIPADHKKYYRYLTDSTYNMEGLGDILYVYANIDSLLDEKVFYYAKYERFSQMELIPEPGVTREDCIRFMEKFKRAILVLNHAMQKDNPGNAEKDSIRMRLQRIPEIKDDPMAKDRILRSLYP
jgi:hypothetical protein